MKKIIGILGILFITTSVFGQVNIGGLSHIERYNWQGTDDFVHFTTVINDHTHYYILAYEPNFPRGHYSGIERNVYLYCIETSDSPWVRVSDIESSGSRWLRVSDAVLENYYYGSKNFQDVDFYTYDENRHNTSNSTVTLDGNNVIFTLDVHKMENGSITITSQTFTLELKWHTFNGNFYTVKK